MAHPDRFSGIAGLDATMGMEGVRKLEWAVKELGFIGAHFYPHWFELAPDHRRWYPFYAKCAELDIPVQMQIGQSLIYDPQRPLRSVGQPITLDTVACELPEVKLVGIHVGIPWVDEMMFVATKHPNVHIVADAHAPKHWPQQFVNFINTYGQDKVIFGTDYPVLTQQRMRDEVEGLELREGPKRKFLRDKRHRALGPRPLSRHHADHTPSDISTRHGKGARHDQQRIGGDDRRRRAQSRASKRPTSPHSRSMSCCRAFDAEVVDDLGADTFAQFVEPDGQLAKVSVHAWLVQSPQSTILVDTCTGNHKSRPAMEDHAHARHAVAGPAAGRRR